MSEFLEPVDIRNKTSWRRRLLLNCGDPISQEPGSDGRIWVYYNVTSIESTTKILNNATGLTSDMEVDGVSVTRANSYQFSETGMHLVKFGYTGFTALSGTFYGVGNIVNVYFPKNVLTTTTRSNAPFYCTWIYGKVYVPGPINEMPLSGYVYGNGSTGINAEIEIYGLQNWTITDWNPNNVKKVTIKGTFSSIPNNVFRGFNAANDFRYIWVESPNLTSIGNGFISNMNGIETVVVNVESPPTLSSTNALNANNTFKLYVPYSSDHSILNAYKAAEVWSNKASQIYELTSAGQIPISGQSDI